MSNVLKKIERKVGQAQQEQESSGMTSMLDDIRTGIESLRTIAEQDSSRDERTSTLEKLVIRLYDALTKSEEERKAEDAQESKDHAEVDRIGKVEQLLAESQSARLDDARIMGDLRASLARNEALYEAEKRARIVAEQALSDSNMQHDKHMAMMCGAEEKTDVELTGWDIIPIRDTADKPLRYELTPKKN